MASIDRIKFNPARGQKTKNVTTEPRTVDQQFHEVQLNALRYFDMTDLLDVERMTMNEYYLRLEAHQLKQVDEQQKLAMQSWFNQTVKAQTGSAKHPKPKYKRFDQFFNAEKQEEQITHYFEPGTKTLIESKRTKKIEAFEVFNQRRVEFEKFKAQKGG
ncbi:hypothetical protein [Loigolactobacillus backii]|uniref:hypothetical protein n=1 Tax=Loigolactobacillus backii TaxID=375175 RepID=UPI0022FD9167|nr:hypothetical protein [Loigolactobacillus backii]MDA5386952.1 hypothetical protein [Loigolactobacillus backii]MDA5389490.1 hypothetical protein [Loigolactobacillus backii]